MVFIWQKSHYYFHKIIYLIIIDSKHGWLSLVDIVVTTPGRLVDHLYYTEGFSLKSLRFLVLDEADSFTNISQNEWLNQVNDNLGNLFLMINFVFIV